ncbi:MAG: hypothetical protein EOO71_07185, partial [Myxococcaceae bacterium]
MRGDGDEQSHVGGEALRRGLGWIGRLHGPHERGLPGARSGGRPAPIVGVSLLAVAPTGEYQPDKLINLGSNRWAFKPEIGLSYPIGRWQADAYAAVWL